MHDCLGSWGVDSEAWVTNMIKQSMVGSGGEGGPADVS